MTKDLNLKGYFFLPDKPDEQLPGILKFDQETGIVVELFGQFHQYIGPSSKENNILLGFTENGKEITLLNCFERSRNMSMPGFAISEFSALYLFYGKHYHSFENIRFDKCSVEFTDMNAWLGISGFEQPLFDEKSKEIQIKYKPPPKIVFRISEKWQGEIDFSFTHPIQFLVPPQRALIQQHPFISFLPSAKTCFKDYQDTFQCFLSFAALNYFAFPPIESIYFYEKAVKEDEYDPEFDTIELFYKMGLKKESYKAHNNMHDFILQYINYADRFETVITNWYLLFGKIDASVKMLAEDLMARGMPSEFKFLSLSQALENMHRALTGKIKMKLHQRLNEIINLLPPKIKDALLSNEPNFARRIYDNRNYYTHLSSREQFTPASLSELFLLAEKMKVILLSYLLLEISFTEKETETIIYEKGRFLFNHVMNYSPAPRSHL